MSEVKKPQSAYFMWMNATREKIAEELGGKPGFGDVARKAAEKWKAITDAERKPWDDKAKAAKEAFDEFKKTPEGQKALEEKKDEKKGKKDVKTKRDLKSAVKSVEKDDKLKRPLSSYFIWINDNRESITAKMGGKPSTGDITKKCAEVWRGLSEADKKPWDDKAKKLKEEFEAYKASPEGEAAFKAYNDATDEAKSQVKGAPVEKAPAEKKERKNKKDKSDDKSDDQAESSPSPAAKKRPKKQEAAKAEPSPKKAKGKNAKAEAPGVVLDEAILSAAEKAGYGAQLRNLSKRDDIIAKGCDGKALLKALQSNDGLVNKAKLSLLGGA